ncbi:MAG: metal-dependent transcriptional regulator [Brachymonas sp.]|nr:metal-dependent transcriptional regulator [Brachymonas sp.]
MPTKEDYLRIIYEEGGLESIVSNKMIAEKLGLTAASVSEMLTKLSSQGLIDYQAYKGSRLTPDGLAACMDVVRSHRLWEVFLIRHLGYSWRESHEDAHLLEHAASPRMLERLDAFLNYPQTCPHGSLIPREGEALRQASLQRLSDLAVGDHAIVRRVVEDGALLDYLERSGVEVHQPIRVLAVEDYEGPISFEQGDQTISLSYKAATQIFVERRSGASPRKRKS